MSFRFFSSADSPNGYNIYSGPSGLFDLLDMCLVYGYTDHPPLGWTLEERSETHRVYRSSQGTQRKFLRISNTTDPTGSFYSVNVLDSLAPDTNAWFTPEVSTANTPFANNWPCQKSNASTATPWIVFGDAQFFTILVVSGVTVIPISSQIHMLFFGEIEGNTYINVNDIFGAGSSGERTRFMRSLSTAATGSASLFTNIDNPLSYPEIAGQQVSEIANTILFDPGRDMHRRCTVGLFRHASFESDTTGSTPFGSRALNEFRVNYDGVMPYSKLYFTAKPTINDRFGYQIMAVHPHLLVSGGSPRDTIFANADAPWNERILNSNIVTIEGVRYLPFIIGTSNDGSFIFIRIE